MAVHEPPDPVGATQDVCHPDGHVERLASVDADPAPLEPDRVGQIVAPRDHLVVGNKRPPENRLPTQVNVFVTAS